MNPTRITTKISSPSMVRILIACLTISLIGVTLSKPSLAADAKPEATIKNKDAEASVLLGDKIKPALAGARPEGDDDGSR